MPTWKELIRTSIREIGRLLAQGHQQGGVIPGGPSPRRRHERG